MNKKEKNKDMIKILIAGGNDVGGVSFRSSFFAKKSKLNNIYYDGFGSERGEILLSDGEKKKFIFIVEEGQKCIEVLQLNIQKMLKVFY